MESGAAAAEGIYLEESSRDLKILQPLRTPLQETKQPVQEKLFSSVPLMKCLLANKSL
jgi:hypothetical protein